MRNIKRKRIIKSFSQFLDAFKNEIDEKQEFRRLSDDYDDLIEFIDDNIDLNIHSNSEMKNQYELRKERFKKDWKETSIIRLLLIEWLTLQFIWLKEKSENISEVYQESDEEFRLLANNQNSFFFDLKRLCLREEVKKWKSYMLLNLHFSLCLAEVMEQYLIYNFYNRSDNPFTPIYWEFFVDTAFENFWSGNNDIVITLLAMLNETFDINE